MAKGWQTRLPYELDAAAEDARLTAHGGVPLVIEAFRVSGAAQLLDARLVIKRRKRGLSPSELVEGLFAPRAAGGASAALRSAARISRVCARIRRWPRCSGTACRRRRRRGTSWRRSTRRRHRCGGASGRGCRARASGCRGWRRSTGG